MILLFLSIVNNEKARIRYVSLMKRINNDLEALEKDIPREDSAMCLPLAMTTKIVDKRNLRNLIDMSSQRECTRAYWEYKELMSDIKSELSKISDEWVWIVDNLFKPKCEKLNYCPERKSCGRKEKRND